MNASLIEKAAKQRIARCRRGFTCAKVNEPSTIPTACRLKSSP